MKSSLSDTEGHGNFQKLYENEFISNYYIVKITVMLQCCSYRYAAMLQSFVILYVLFDDIIIICEYLNPFTPKIS